MPTSKAGASACVTRATPPPAPCTRWQCWKELRERLQGGGAEDSRREHEEARLACVEHAPGLLEPPEELDAAGLFGAIPGLQQREPLAQALWLRLLFSALVDADSLDTESYMNRRRSSARPGFPLLAECRSWLDDHLEKKAIPFVIEHESELGNAHAHDLFDRLQVTRSAAATGPARDFGAYSIMFEGRSLAPGERIEAAAGDTLIRRC